MNIKRNNIFISFVLLLSGFYPLAWISDFPLTLYPIFNNTISDYKIWIWNDITAFALTHSLLVIGFFYFGLKENKFALKLLSVVHIVNCLIVGLILAIKDIQTSQFNELELNLGFGLYLLIFISIISISNFLISPQKSDD